MKLPTVLLVLVLSSLGVHAQVADPVDKARDKVNDRANDAVDRATDRVLDRAEERLKRLFRRKDKDAPPAPSDKPAATSPSPAATGIVAATGAAAAPAGLRANSRFDFVSGDQVLMFEEFEGDKQGDFPARWNTNAGGEMVRLDGQAGLWLQLPGRGLVYPEAVRELPENFTLEFDMAVSEDLSENMSGLMLVFPQADRRNARFDVQMGQDPQAGVDLHPRPIGGGSSYAWVFDKSGTKVLENESKMPWKAGSVNRVSVWRQKTRLRLYVNEVKVWDLPRAFDPGVNYSVLWAANLFEGQVYLGPVRLAVGAPDMRNKLLSEGRFVTRGILFDVGADRIRPESYGVLKEIGGVLAENPSVNVLIVGHTDSDGDAQRNVELSLRRAEAVKAALAGEFGIAAARMTTDGQGARQPVEPNTTPQGKANNRRVEFVRR